MDTLNLSPKTGRNFCTPKMANPPLGNGGAAVLGQRQNQSGNHNSSTRSACVSCQVTLIRPAGAHRVPLCEQCWRWSGVLDHISVACQLLREV